MSSTVRMCRAGAGSTSRPFSLDGYRKLACGQHVLFRTKVASQDGFAYRAVKVWTGDEEPADQPRTQRSSIAYHSSLTLTFDPPCPNDVVGPQE